MSDGIDNPGTIPDLDFGFYPNVRTGDPIGGLISNAPYYVDVVDANNIRLLNAPSGSVLDITSAGTGPAHQIILSVDGINNQY